MSKQVCRKQPFPNGKHLLPKECPKKERLFDMNRLEGRISVRPCTGVLTKVPLLPMERRNLCLLKPCVWGKLNTAPRVFTKLLKPVAAYLRKIGIRIIIYLDDFLYLNAKLHEAYVRYFHPLSHILYLYLIYKTAYPCYVVYS